MHPDKKYPQADQQIDDIMRQALLLEADDLRIERLRQYWVRQSRQTTGRRHKLLAASLIAASLAAVSLLFMQSDSNNDEATHSADDNLVAAESNAPMLGSVSPPEKESSTTYGREPTEYERILFAARATDHNSPKHTEVANIDELAHKLVQTSVSSVPEVLASTGYNQRDAIVGLLKLSRDSSQRGPALAALEKLVGVAGLGKLARSSRFPEIRAALMLRLLESDTDSSLKEYLSLIGNLALREQALAVAEQVAQPPVGRLLKLLDDQEKSVRLAAAVTLGYLNGPEVTRLLIARVNDHPANSTEAWLALLACRGEMADEFLAYAEHRPQLLGYYNNARILWAQMTP